MSLLLDHALCFTLYSTSLAMSKVYRKLLRRLDVTYSQYLVLMVLWEKDEISVSDIGERLFLDSATLTPLLKRMELAGLISRLRAVDDERSVLISLTKKGQKLREKAEDIPSDLLCATGCTVEHLMSIKKDLESLREKLGENG